MGSLLSQESKQRKSGKLKQPWYKNKSRRTSVLVTVAVFAFAVIFVASVKHRIHRGSVPYLLTINEQSAFITTSLLDLHYQKHLDLPKLAEKGNIQFRAITTRNYNEITIANGQAKHSFFATFQCNRVPGWKLDSYFLNETEFAAHPYGLAWDDVHEWWLFTTQNTASLFIYDTDGRPVELPGMKLHFPGAVFTLLNGSSGHLQMDTFIPDSVPFSLESHHDQKRELKSETPNNGLRGIAVDSNLGLIFVAAEILGNVLVFDMNNRFENIYNISFPQRKKGVAPISVVNGAPYFPNTLFVTEKKHNDGVFAFHYTRNGYDLWWQAQEAPLLKHATGVAVSADSLFVVSMKRQRILRYSPYTGHYLGEVVHFAGSNPSGIITHSGIGKVGNPVAFRDTLGEQLLYIPSHKPCTVM